jgi:hypothetical protein
MDASHTRCNEASRQFTQQMLRQRASATFGEAKQFDQVLGGAAHQRLLAAQP